MQTMTLKDQAHYLAVSEEEEDDDNNKEVLAI
jgi:hypothetical protein